jgi:hypothetical protein
VKKLALALAGVVVAGALALVWQRARPEAPREETSEELPPPAADTGDSQQRTRALAEESFALLRERAALKSALHATTAAPIPGLPAPPFALYSAEETRLFDEIHQRVFGEAVPRLVEMHRAAKGAPPAGATPEALFGALLAPPRSRTSRRSSLTSRPSRSSRSRTARPPPTPRSPSACSGSSPRQATRWSAR